MVDSHQAQRSVHVQVRAERNSASAVVAVAGSGKQAGNGLMNGVDLELVAGVAGVGSCAAEEIEVGIGMVFPQSQ